MFLYELNLIEKAAFLQLAKELVVIDDGVIDENEMNMLMIMANEMQISVSENLSLDFNLQQLAKSFKDKKAQKICLIELIALAFANDDYHPEQNSLIKALMNEFSIQIEEIDEMEQWVEKMIVLHRHGQTLIERI